MFWVLRDKRVAQHTGPIKPAPCVASWPRRFTAVATLWPEISRRHNSDAYVLRAAYWRYGRAARYAERIVHVTMANITRFNPHAGNSVRNLEQAVIPCRTAAPAAMRTQRLNSIEFSIYSLSTSFHPRRAQTNRPDAPRILIRFNQNPINALKLNPNHTKIQYPYKSTIMQFK
jgi:hypothetical protein